MQHPNKEHIQGKKENSYPNQKFEHSVRNLCFRKFEIPTPLFSLGNLIKKKTSGNYKQQDPTNNKQHLSPIFQTSIWKYSKHTLNFTQGKRADGYARHKFKERFRKIRCALQRNQRAFITPSKRIFAPQKEVHITLVAPKTTLNASSKHFTKV